MGFLKKTCFTEVGWSGGGGVLEKRKGGQNVRLSDLLIMIRSSDCIGQYNRRFQGATFVSGDCIDPFLSTDSLLT